MNPGASVMCLTYYGSVKVVPYYNVMGVAKAALESSTRYLAYDLGPEEIRVNAISAGPIRTLAAAGVGGFRDMYKHFADMAPLRENVTIEDVGNSAVFLASDLSAHITGEVLYVDSGFNTMGVQMSRERCRIVDWFLGDDDKWRSCCFGAMPALFVFYGKITLICSNATPPPL